MKLAQLKAISNSKSGCKLLSTGQVLADRSKISLVFSSKFKPDGINTWATILPTLLGSDTMILVTSTRVPSNSIPIVSALMPIVVIMQEPSAVANKSVGENLSPLPLLSVGASVSISVPLCKCVQLVLIPDL